MSNIPVPDRALAFPEGQHSDRRRQVILTEVGLAAMVLIWGINFVVVKRALEVFDPLGFNALRHLLAAAFMIAVLVARDGIGRPARGDVWRVVVLGIVGNFIYQMAFIVGLERTTAGNASLMLATVPIFLLIFGRKQNGGGPRAHPLLGVALSIGGVALVSGSSLGIEGLDTLTGDALLLGAAAVWAIYTVGAQPLIDRYGPIRTTAWTLLVGSLGLFLAGLPSLAQQNWSLVTVEAWGGVLFSSLLSVGVAYLLWYRGVQQLGGARTALFSNLTPVVALAAGAVWLGESLTRYSIVGAALVIGGLLLVRTGPKR